MKEYIAPSCEMMSLAAAEMLALSFVVDPTTNVSTQLSNRFDEYEDEWEE